MNICQKLTTVTAVSILLTAIGTKQVRADLVTDQFSVTVSSGNLASQQGNGSFSYDNSFVTGSGLETVSVQSLAFNFLNKTYTQNDTFSNAEPTLDLNNGSLVGLNYAVNYDPDLSGFGSFFYIAGTPNLANTVGGPTFYEGIPDGELNLDMAGTVTYFAATVVPEPSSTSGTLAFGLLGVGSVLLHQQKQRSNKC